MTRPHFEGYYWAKQLKVDPGTTDEEHFVQSSVWEIVDVYANSLAGPLEFRVFVPGIETSQHLDNFEWGPHVPKPESLK